MATDGYKIGFAGLSHLGLVSAVASAEKGFATIGFDTDAGKIARLRDGEPDVLEPGLEDAMATNAARLAFSDQIADLGSCDLVYLALDVATDEAGNSDLAALESLFDAVVAARGEGSVVVVLSQVPPGFSRARAQRHSDIFYQVETLIFGRALERALHPERIIIGCERPDQPLPGPYANFLGAFDCPLLPMRFESAELSKIAINICLVATISATNTLAEVCEKIGADWSEIAPGLRLDKRIGKFAYLAPGLGLAGGNLERDLATVQRLAAAHRTDSGVIDAFVSNSRRRKDWVMQQLKAARSAETGTPKIGVLGLTYKADTHSIKNSPSLDLLEQLSDCALSVYDPVVGSQVLDRDDLDFASSALGACSHADAVAVMTPWPEFGQLDLAAVANAMQGKLIIDPFCVFEPDDCARVGLVHKGLGRPQTEGEKRDS